MQIHACYICGISIFLSLIKKTRKNKRSVEMTLRIIVNLDIKNIWFFFFGIIKDFTVFEENCITGI